MLSNNKYIHITKNRIGYFNALQRAGVTTFKLKPNLVDEMANFMNTYKYTKWKKFKRIVKL